MALFQLDAEAFSRVLQFRIVFSGFRQFIEEPFCTGDAQPSRARTNRFRVCRIVYAENLFDKFARNWVSIDDLLQVGFVETLLDQLPEIVGEFLRVAN